MPGATTTKLQENIFLQFDVTLIISINKTHTCLELYFESDTKIYCTLVLINEHANIIVGHNKRCCVECMYIRASKGVDYQSMLLQCIVFSYSISKLK